MELERAVTELAATDMTQELTAQVLTVGSRGQLKGEPSYPDYPGPKEPWATSYLMRGVCSCK